MSNGKHSWSAAGRETSFFAAKSFQFTAKTWKKRVADGLSLKDEKKVEVIKECKMENGCLIEVSHASFFDG